MANVAPVTARSRGSGHPPVAPFGLVNHRTHPLTIVERPFYRRGVQLLGRWWNGRWGRLARHDIWLKADTVWRVEARRGDGDSKVWSHDYDTEASAIIDAMIARTGGQDQWRDITDVSTQPRRPPPERTADP